MSVNLLGAFKFDVFKLGSFKSNSLKLFRQSLKLAVVLSVSLTTGCSSSNLFEGFATTDDGPSLIRKAKDAMSESDYAAAISACEEMSASEAAEDEALYICSSAYFGSCGFTLFTVVNQVSSYTGTPLLFEYFMEQNNGATLAKVSACNTGLSKLRELGTAAQRNGDQNYLALFSAFTNMGVILNLVADTNDDGNPDGDICTDLTNAQTNQFGKALWELYRATEVIDSSFSEIDDVKTALDTLSTAIDAVDVSYNFLKSTVDPDAYTNNHRLGIKALIRENAVFGLNAGCGTFATCICP